MLRSHAKLWVFTYTLDLCKILCTMAVQNSQMSVQNCVCAAVCPDIPRFLFRPLLLYTHALYWMYITAAVQRIWQFSNTVCLCRQCQKSKPKISYACIYVGNIIHTLLYHQTTNVQYSQLCGTKLPNSMTTNNFKLNSVLVLRYVQILYTNYKWNN